jgi:hypothetical protein
LINDIFGKSGLKSAENECDFDLQAMELAEKYADKIPRFAAYFSNQCLPNIKNYVWKPTFDVVEMALYVTEKSMICLVVAIPVQINWTHHDRCCM